MGRFVGLGGIRTNQGGLYFLKGDYEVTIDEVKFITNRKKKDCFIISARVDKSTNPDRAPGCKPSQVITIREDIRETCMSNVKQFASAILGIDDPDAYEPENGVDVDQFWDDTLEQLVSDEQPAKGIKIKLNVTEILTKEGKPFSKHFWGPVIA